jgi:hypothetical protein
MSSPNPFDVAQAKQPTGSRPCLFCKKLAGLTKHQIELLNTALDDEKYRASTIVTVLTDWGLVAIKPKDVLRHRPFGVSDQCKTKYPEGRTK